MDGADLIEGYSGNDTLWGMGGDDTIIGDANNDFIIGDANNDWLDGGYDNDTLIGGSGSDTFRFEVTTLFGDHGADVITDFNVTQDHLQIEGLNAYLFDGSIDDLGITQVGANTRITYDLWEGSITLNNVNMNDLLANAGSVFTFIG